MLLLSLHVTSYAEIDRLRASYAAHTIRLTALQFPIHLNCYNLIAPIQKHYANLQQANHNLHRTLLPNRVEIVVPVFDSESVFKQLLNSSLTMGENKIERNAN